MSLMISWGLTKLLNSNWLLSVFKIAKVFLRKYRFLSSGFFSNSLKIVIMIWSSFWYWIHCKIKIWYSSSPLSSIINCCSFSSKLALILKLEDFSISVSSLYCGKEMFNLLYLLMISLILPVYLQTKPIFS